MMHSFGPLRHLDLWSVAAFETDGSGDSRSSRSGGGSPRGSTMSAPKNTAVQNIKMDLGLEPKNDVYYRDITARGISSQAAMESMMSNKSDDGPGLSSAASRAAGGSGVTSSSAVDPAVASQMSAVQQAADAVTSGAGGGNQENMTGLQSTILTQASGLLSKDDDEDAKTRNRRSLIGS